MGDAGAGAVDPVVWLITGIAVATVLTMLALRAAARRHEDSDPLTNLFDRPTFEERLTKSAGSSGRPASQSADRTAALSGRLDHLGQVGNIWGQDMRRDAIEQVAQVMRGGVRKTDHFAHCETEQFTILAGGASEAEAGMIAKRLMQRLAMMPVPGTDESLRLTASFSVAERREGESDTELRERARAALGRAHLETEGRIEDQIIAASDWEEVRFLPSPAPSDQPQAESDDSAAA